MPAVAAAAVLAALFLLLDPPSADLAAQTYRTGLFERIGWSAWDNHWYGGHHLPGYSVLFPPLAAALRPEVVAALSAVAATAAVARIAGGRAMPAATWFAVGMAATLVSGRLAFALGVAVATWAVLAALRGRAGLAAAGGALTALCSPVAALFAALIGAALWLDRRGGAGVALAAGAVAVTAALVALFPEGGTEPFVASAFWPAFAATLIAAAAAGRAHRTVRWAALLYAVVLLGAFVVDSPLGGNAARLGALAGGPLAVALIRDRRALVLAAVPLAYWSLYPAVRDWSQAHGDPARLASYYEELLPRVAGMQRLEIPFTEGHWEAAHVAPHVPIARGWERQLDHKVNAVFYEGSLTAPRYEAWLRENAVSHVAVHDAPLDYSAEAEAALIAGGLPYLEETWRGEHWRLYAVRDPESLGATAQGHDWFEGPPGLVRIRWTPYWKVVRGGGCVEPDGEWTRVTGTSDVRVEIDFDPLRALSNGRRCG